MDSIDRVRAVVGRLVVVTVFGCAVNAPASRSTPTPALDVGESARLVGVWKPVEIAIAPNATAHAGDNAGRAGPGLWLFTKRHYAILDVHTTVPRPSLSSRPTAEELMATWGPFGANAGTYTAAGPTITMQPTVAKNPQTMIPGHTVTLSYRIQGDTLWLWGLNGRLTEMVKHVRVE